jgi:hypothetical protein
MADEVIRTPYCPWCGEPPRAALSAQQAFCGNDDCQAFMWDMTQTAARLLANVHVIDLDRQDDAAGG